jgi:hypothetical protein
LRRDDENPPAVIRRLRCHRSAAFGTAAAGTDALLHAVEALAVGRALLANFGTFGAGVLVMLRTDEHEVRRRPAHFSASHHESEVTWFDVLPAGFKAVVHRHAKARLVATETFIDAGLHR